MRKMQIYRGGGKRLFEARGIKYPNSVRISSKFYQTIIRVGESEPGRMVTGSTVHSGEWLQGLTTLGRMVIKS